MSDGDKPLQFSAKDLMPEWAQESSSSPKERRQPPGEDRGDRGGKGRGGRQRGRPGGHRGGGDRRGGGFGGRDDRRGGGGPSGGRADRRGGPRGRGDRRGGAGHGNRPPEEKPLEGVNASLEPTAAAVAGLAQLIRKTLRAYPLADLAKMILKGRERYQVRFRSEEGGPPLYFCEVDGSLWVSRDEAVNHLLNSKVIDSFYDVEIVEVDAPAGNFSVVAICGMSGKILGPPNHHEYRASVTRLHAERFSHMSIERFKSRITMESGEEAIEKWKEQVSRVKQFRVKSEGPDEAEEAVVKEEAVEAVVEPVEEPSVKAPAEESISESADETPAAEETVEAVAADIQDEGSGEGEVEQPEVEVTAEEASGDLEGEETAEPEADTEPAPKSEAAPEVEALVLKTAQELATHFRQNFAESAVVETRNAVVPGNVSGKNLSRGLLLHLKQESEKLRRGFPLPMIQALCKEFEKQGLKFFKRGKKALHVSVVRPRGIDESASLTEQVQSIVDYLVANPRSKVVDLLDALAEDFSKPEKKEGATTEELELTDEAKTILTDLRWLAAEGYVIEFPDTCLVIGKQPRPQESASAGKKVTEEKKAEAPEKAEEKSPETEGEKEKSTQTPVAGEVPQSQAEQLPFTGEEKAEEPAEAEESPAEEAAPEEAAPEEGKAEEGKAEELAADKKPPEELPAEPEVKDSQEEEEKVEA